MLPFYAASGLLAPVWAILALGIVWTGLAAVVVRHRRTPAVLLVPFAALAIWFGAITAGEQLLGWTG